MAKLTKRACLIAEKVEATKLYSIEEAVVLLCDLSTVKFKESIDVSVNLGVDARKSEQVIRGSTILPHGTGKDVRVAVFAQGANAEAAKEAGADIVGLHDLAEQVKAGNLDFDVVIAAPDSMRIVGQLGQILGPRGLMPNPKVGTVTPDIATAVQHAQAGQARYRTDKNGIIHASIGSIDFASESIKGNLEALLADLHRAKPASSKGVFIKKVILSSTMGPGLQIDLGALSSTK